MSKSIIGILIFLSLATSSAAQYTKADTYLHQDTMITDSNLLMRRWAGHTLGVRLSSDEALLFTDSTAIIIGVNGRPNRLIATYFFNPILLPHSLQLEISQLKTIILGNFGSENDTNKFHSVPKWLAPLYQLESLVLLNAQLDNIKFLEHLPLKYLDLRNVRYDSSSSPLETIGKLHGLKIFIHDKSFSFEDITIIKKLLPETIIVLKPSSD